MKSLSVLTLVFTLTSTLAPCRAVVGRRPGQPAPFQEPSAAYFPQTDRVTTTVARVGEESLTSFQRASRSAFRVTWDDSTGAVRTMYQGRSRAYSADPATAATAFVAEAAFLGSAPLRQSLVVSAVRANAFGHQVTLRQTVEGVPVLGRQVTVNLDNSGAVLTAENTVAPIGAVNTVPSVSALAAAAVATGKMVKGPELFVQTSAPQPRLVWRLVYSPSHDKIIRATVDAHTGDLLLSENVIESLSTGSGKVYIGNPVSTPTLTTQPLPWMDGTGNLTGSFAKAYNGEPPGAQTVNEPTLVYNYAAGNVKLAELQAYYGITAIHDYFKGNLGFTGRDQQMPAFVHIVGLDNAFFSSQIGADGGMEFGYNSAGTEYALDSDVLYHEYTHAVIDRWSSAFADAYDYYHEQGGMNEGLADYFSASKLNDPFLAEYALAGGYERDLRARYHFPEDIQLPAYDSTTKRYYQDFPEVHHTGEIWGPACWDLRQAIGQTKADAIIFKAVSLFGAATRMQDALALLLTADTQLNAGANAAAIRKAFNARGIYETAYPVAYLDPDTFYAATGTTASKVYTGWTFQDGSGAYYQPLGLFPAITADRWYLLQGYSTDSTVKSVFVVIKSGTGQLLGYSGNDTSAFATSYKSINTWYQFPSTLVLAGQASRTCRFYIQSYTQTAATVAAAFTTTAAKGIAPASPNVITALLLKVRRGDVNTDGVVNMRDAIIALRFVTGRDYLTRWEAPQGDVVAPTTGQPDMADVKQMLKIAAGLA